MSSANAQSGTALTNTAPVASKTPARQAIQPRCSPHRNIGPAPQQNTTSATDLANAARDFGPSTPCPSAANHKRVPLRAKPYKKVLSTIDRDCRLQATQTRYIAPVLNGVPATCPQPHTRRLWIIR